MSHTKRKPYAKTIILGMIAAALYALLLMKQEVINDYFTRGSLYAFLPIGIAFLFSFVHGTFTGNFWTIMGIEAKKKK